MKSSIVLFTAIFLLFQCAGCRKGTIEPVADTKETIEPITDTTTIELSPANGEVTIENLTWIFPWYNSIEIRDFSNMLPSAASFKVFIQRDRSPEWKGVPLISFDSNVATEYEYFVEKRLDGAGIYNFGSLYIFYYGADVSDSPSVKIEY